MNRTHLCLLAAAVLAACAAAQTAKTPARVFRLHTVTEPREGAFTTLVPDGWTTQGGVYRIDPSHAGGAGNSVSAKVDFIVTRDAAGTAMTHRLPDMLYKDMSRSPAAGMFPPGSNYAGMTVSPPMDAITFLLNVVLRKARPQARNMQVQARIPLPGVARSYDQMDRSMGLPADWRNDTGMVFVAYDEGSTHFQEVLYTDIQYWGMGLGTWGNKDTYMARAPADEFAGLCPVFKAMNESSKMNPQWMNRELQSQAARGKVIGDVQQHNARIDDEIVRHRQQTNAEINHQMQALLSDRTTEVDPFTGKRHDMPAYNSSGQAGRVYYNPDGTAILSNDPNWNPEQDPKYANRGYKPAAQ